MKQIITLKGLSIFILIHFLLSSFILPTDNGSKEIPLSKEPSFVEEDRSNDYIMPHAYLLNQMITIDLIYPTDKVEVNVINTTNNSFLHSQVYYNTSFIQFNINMIAGDEYELNIIHDKWELSGYFEL